MHKPSTRWLSHNAAPEGRTLFEKVRNAQFAKRRLLKKIGLRRSQPLNFPIPTVDDDFTKLARLNFERLKDGYNRGRSNSQSSESAKDARPLPRDHGLDGPRIRYFPPIVRSPDSQFLFDPTTNSVTSLKASVIQDVDSILQTFKSLQQEPPTATLPTGRITIRRLGSSPFRASELPASRKRLAGDSSQYKVRSYATLTSHHVRPDAKSNVTFTGGEAHETRERRNTHASTLAESSSMIGDDAHIRRHLEAWAADNEKHFVSSSDRGKVINPVGYLAQNTITQSGEDDVISDVDNSDIEVSDDDDGELIGDEATQSGSWDDNSSFVSNQHFYEVGDLVEINRAAGHFGVFIKYFTDRYILLYADTGQWKVIDSRKAGFSTPRFVPPHVLSDIFPFVPASHSIETLQYLDEIQSQAPPRNVGLQARASMEDFRTAAGDVYRRFADRLDRAHLILAFDRVSDGSRYVTLEEAAMEVYELPPHSKPTPEMRWLVRSKLIIAPSVVPCEGNSSLYAAFEILPRESLKSLTMVQEWVREYQEVKIKSAVSSPKSGKSHSARYGGSVIADFAKKAEKLVRQSRRERRLCSARFDHSKFESRESDSERHDLSIFNSDDRLIIDFMYAWAATRRINASNPTSPAAPAILRAVGAYKDHELTLDVGYTFLEELGVITSQQNPDLLRLTEGLPGFCTLHSAHRLQQEAQEETRKYIQSHVLLDSMAAFRKDWGDLAVYCLDSAGTTDRDDGLSIEPIRDSSDVWLHVHVANPTAFIDPNSASGLFAQKMLLSRYLPEVRISLLDEKLVQEYFTLNKNRPVISFSAKVNTEGEILETEVSHGFIHNVQIVTHEQYAKVFSLEPMTDNAQNSTISVGPRTSPAQDQSAESSIVSQSLSAKAIQDLERLRLYATSLTDKNFKHTSMVKFNNFDQAELPRMAISVRCQKSLSSMRPSIQPHYDIQTRIDGTTIDIKPALNAPVEAKSLIEPLMLLAGQICGDWCAKRNIPVLYRGFRCKPNPPLNFQIKSTEISDYLEKAPSKEERTFRTLQLREIGTFVHSSAPLYHPLVHVPAYVMATSPLRRYSDMLAHWQIEAFLRAEQEQKLSGRTLTAVDPPTLPFSSGMVEAVAARHAGFAVQQKKFQAKSEKYWTAMTLYRAVYMQEAELPSPLKAKITSLYNTPLNRKVRAQLVDYWQPISFNPRIYSWSSNCPFKLNDIWEVEIDSILPYSKRIDANPVRLLHRDL